MKTLHTASLLLATLCTGLMAGLFTAFAYAVMPGLARTDDHGFVQAMHHINRSIINGWFMTPFLLPLPLLVLAAVLSARGERPGALTWTIAALVLYLAAFLVTGAQNVPLNDALDKVPLDASSDRLHAARVAFEARWVRWNTVRALLHTASFGCLLWALLSHDSHSGEAAAEQLRRTR
ncbi:DUF1772 domain-containing protein [Streptomyces sp. B1I3]|uniref:anthrone oxygenase family protein n=1 Tax=Streptomyces sp. B1I3 TaxID=3042264 RepID=UPI0027865D6A|nr:anthrone oxygenase family protein [Streptomyces sp. B1I3]MDQ0792839.1 putative membrane protein [Streptomyces sp. B1I3]